MRPNMFSYIQCGAQDTHLYLVKYSGSSFKFGTSPGYPTIPGIREMMDLLYTTRDQEWPSDIQLRACDALFYTQSKAKDDLISYKRPRVPSYVRYKIKDVLFYPVKDCG